MSITYTIPGATLLDQLNEPTVDGQADEDARDNCVAASIAEGLTILTGKKYTGDQIKDLVYGQGYVGTQSAQRYIAYCATQGVDLVAHNDTQAGLVAMIRAQVIEAHPVVLTMPSNWATPYTDPLHPSGPTHVGIAVGEGPDAIRVMNPWHGFMQDASDEWWQPRLCYGQVWVMSKKATTTVSTGTPAAGSATPFYGLTYTSDAQVWHCPATNHNVGHGFRAFYAGVSGPNGQSGTEILGLPLTDEYDVGALVKQDFERGRLVYDASKAAPWQVTLDAVGHDLEQTASVQSALTTAQGQITTLNDLVTSLKAQLYAAQSAAANNGDSATLAAFRTALKAVLG